MLDARCKVRLNRPGELQKTLPVLFLIFLLSAQRAAASQKQSGPQKR
jgi:hypothetical protein